MRSAIVSVARYAEDSSRGHITMSDWMARFIPRSLEALESMVAESGKHCFGNRITMADICLVPQIYNTRRWKLSLDPYPSISKISERISKTLPCFPRRPSGPVPAVRQGKGKPCRRFGRWRSLSMHERRTAPVSAVTGITCGSLASFRTSSGPGRIPVDLAFYPENSNGTPTFHCSVSLRSIRCRHPRPLPKRRGP